MKTLANGAALLLAFTLPGVSLAQTSLAPDTETVAVPYADLDLNRPAEIRLLNNRLRSAALQVCGDANLVAAAPRARHWCVKNAVTEGWDQVAANRAIQSAENRTIVIAALRTRPRP